MKIQSVEFIKSVVNVDDIPNDDLLELAFAGRSNVGKSSLINCLLNRKKLAKTSSTPGKTRQLNYFLINNGFYFVDLPGYGYARVSEQERLRWQALIESYFHKSKKLRGVVSLIDSRVGPTPLDKQLLSWVQALQLNVLVVATKADKLSKAVLAQNLKNHQGQLADLFLGKIIPFSSLTGAGKRELLSGILNLME